MEEYYPLGDDVSLVQLLDTMPRFEELRYPSRDIITSLDAAVVSAARVSYGLGLKSYDEDVRLIQYLYRNKHSSPFEQVTLKFRIVAPLPIVAQHMRHRTWAYNQTSRRYTSEGIKFYVPEWRWQGLYNKQISGDKIEPDLQESLCVEYQRVVEDCLDLYESMVELGVSREQARFVLPQSLYATYVGTVSLHNLMNFLRLRMAPEAQYEMQLYATAMMLLIIKKVPITMGEFLSGLPFNVNHLIDELQDRK